MDPYQSPTTEEVPDIDPTRARSCVGAAAGGFAGGCLLPIALFVMFASLGDPGGILLYPIMGVPCGIIGAIIGGIAFARRKK